MSNDEHRFYFSSNHSIQDKTLATFTVNLPFPLELTGKWKCAILDCYIKLTKLELNSLFILGDFCEISLVEENKQLPILKKVYLKSNENYYNFLHPLYIPVKQTHLSNFSLAFVDPNLQNILLNTDFLIECTIHFYKHGG